MLIVLLGGVAVALAGGPSFADHPGPLARLDVPESDPGSLIKRFVDPMMRGSERTGSGLDDDREHADSTARVVTADTPVYIREGNGPARPPLGSNLVMINGRIFVNYESALDPDKLPQLVIRPIDGNTRIPWLVRVMLTPRMSETSWEQGSVRVTLRFPCIFRPELSVTGVIVNGQKASYSVRAAQTADEYEVTIPVHHQDMLAADPASGCQVFLAGEMKLHPYETESARSFPNLGDVRLPDSLIGLARLIRGRDYAGEDEGRQIEALARQIVGTERNLLTVVRKVNLYVATTLRYYRNTMLRSPMQVVAEGLGDCDDFTRLMIALLRALGVPCAVAVGAIYDFNNFGAHAWVEVAVPQRDGPAWWFLCDPTLASAATDRSFFVRFRSRIYLYPTGIGISVLNMPVHYAADILMNCNDENLKKGASLQAWQAVIASFCNDLETSLQKEILAFANLSSGLAPRREFRFTPASDFILADQPPQALLFDFRSVREPDMVAKFMTSTHKAKDTSRWQVRVTAQDDLVLELGVLDEDYDLGSPDDQRFVALLQELYRQLKDSLVRNQEVRHCLEMTYGRDKHTDRLQKVTIRVNRYLLESHFGKILRLLQEGKFLLAEDSARLQTFFDICHGKNFYFLLESAYRTR
ncbi:MAG: transglutaminase domain-containing protein [Acidobacteria bacterium]|nr:transglutaminase domain-containing protein [Acidobacteriota bacterium]